MRTGFTVLLAAAILLFGTSGLPAQVGYSQTPEAQRTETWVTGTVRDEKGSPVAGATVYASGSYVGAMRELEASAETDAAGHYRIEGAGGQQGLSAWLVVTKPGMPYEVGWAWRSDAMPGAGAVNRPPAPVHDFVLASQGGALDVFIEQERKPASGVTVRLRRLGAEGQQMWDERIDDRTQDKVEALLFPVLTTGADGIAHFKDLPPGLYNVGVGPIDLDRVSSREMLLRGSSFAYAKAVSQPVRAGETTHCRLLLYPQTNQVNLRVLQTDGTPLNGKEVSLTYSRANSWNGDSIVVPVIDGSSTLHFDPVGLYRIAVKFLPHATTPFADEPCFEASGIVASSSLLESAQPIEFKTRWVKRSTVSVQLLDESGNPAAGTVELVQLPNQAPVVRTTDSQGRIKFEGVRNGEYSAFAILQGQREVKFGTVIGEPLPTDESLRGIVLVPTQRLTVRAGMDQHIVLRAVPAGFVRAVLHPPAGSSANDFLLAASDPRNKRAQMEYLHLAGEMVAGPYEAGKIYLRVHRQTDAPGRQPWGVQEVDIKPGEVVHVDVHPAQVHQAADGRPVNAMIGMGTGIQTEGARADEMKGKVFLSDGKTPAYSAVLLCFPAERVQAEVGGITDALGDIHVRDFWIPQERFESPPAGSPAGDVVVAYLPGSTGAAIVAPGPGRPLSITLPAPIRAHGQITVGSVSAAGRIGQFRVLAMHQGKGKLNAALSVWATPQLDGTFELSGLTRGTYQVQASLDGIWLSKSVTLNVGDTDPPPINLDIGDPGGAVAVHLLGLNAQALAGRAISVERPGGPLTDLYWPTQFISDGAGTAYIPALEAGKHVIHVEGTAVSAEVDVPSLSKARTTDLRIETKLSQE